MCFLVSDKNLYRKPVKPIISLNTDFFQKSPAFHRTVKLMLFMNSLTLKTYENFFLDDFIVIFSVFSAM